jgi:uncharacterized membrane protein
MCQVIFDPADKSNRTAESIRTAFYQILTILRVIVDPTTAGMEFLLDYSL